MLERIRPPEPRVEHPVREDEVGFCAAQRLPHTETIELPEAVHDDAVEVCRVVAQPRQKAWRVAIIAACRSERFDALRRILEPRIVRRVEGRDRDVMALRLKHAGAL